jgi:hypothetical protein
LEQPFLNETYVCHWRESAWWLLQR